MKLAKQLTKKLKRKLRLRRNLSSAEFQRQRPVSGRWRLLRVALLWALVVLSCHYLDRRDVRGFGFTYFEQYSYNVRMQISMQRNADLCEWARQQILLVTINDNTFKADNPERLNGRPVHRRCHAKVLSDLVKAGARLVVFDLIFVDDSEPAADRALGEAARQTRERAVWACLIEKNDYSTGITDPIAPLLKANLHYGHILAPQETERLVVKHLAAVHSANAVKIPSLSLQAVRLTAGLADQPLRRAPGWQKGWQVGDLVVPDEIPITYMGRPEDQIFPSVPFEQVYRGATNDPFYKENHFFKDKIVIIGDVTQIGNDYRNTPVGYMAGPEIQANAIATLLLAQRLHRPLLREASPLASLLVMALLTAVACRFAAVWRLWLSFVGALVTLAFYGLVNIVLFTDYGIELRVFAPTVAVLAATLLVLTERGLTEVREKNWMRHLLHRYLSPQIVEYVVEHPEKCLLGGEQITATVLFSDIRGFTQMTQQLEPQKTIALLNEYFQEMTEIVFKHHGTLDKFMGDGIMVFYGAPVPQEDHTRRAVATAIEMQEALENLQNRWREQNLPVLEIGIGINTGEMVFGHMGSHEHMNFSVLGAAVNLAARLEKLNKEFHSRILVSEAVYRVVAHEVTAAGPLKADVQGFEEVTAYEILGWRSPSCV